MTRHKPVLSAVLLLLCLGACRAPYLTPTDTATPTSTLPPTVLVKPSSCVMQYASPALGFAVQYPCDWEAVDLAHGPCAGDSSRVCDALNFQNGDAYGNYYGVSVLRYWPAMGETVTDTVEYGLRDLAPSAREQIESRCCLTVDGEPAMELTFPPLPEDRTRDRRISVAHSGAEYTIMFWWNVPFQPGGVFDLPAEHEAQAAFDAFLRSFTFIPVTETPTPPPPVPTPVPTPTRTPAPGR